jgi:type VI protein secretion system component Hcp
VDKNPTDLMMRFEYESGQPVWSECTLDIADGDDMAKDFMRNTGYDNYTNFFEVSNFAFGISLNPQEGGASASASQPRHGQPSAGDTREFARWRSAVGEEFKQISPKYPLDFDRFTFERVIDSASPKFFQACCKSETFGSAVLIKRLSQGGQGPDGQPRPSVSYLRMEFNDVLIVGINWDDGEVIKEKCEFICRGMTIRYRRQMADGTIAKSESSIVWTPDRGRSIVTLNRTIANG